MSWEAGWISPKYSRWNRDNSPKYFETSPSAAPAQVAQIRRQKGLKERTPKTIREDFFEFLDEGDYTFSYKMVMMLNNLSLLEDLDINQKTKVIN